MVPVLQTKDCAHFYVLLNTANDNMQQYYTYPQQYWHIWILDDPIQLHEVERCIQKATGIDRLSSGIIKLLPSDWLILLTNVFNMDFHRTYAPCWSMSKAFNIYKKRPKRWPAQLQRNQYSVVCDNFSVTCAKVVMWHTRVWIKLGR